MKKLEEVKQRFNIPEEDLQLFLNQKKTQLQKLEKKIQQLDKQILKEEEKQWWVNAVRLGLLKAEKELNTVLQTLQDANEQEKTKLPFEKKLAWVQQQKEAIAKLTPFLRSGTEVLELAFQVEQLQEEQAKLRELFLGEA